MVQSLVAPSLAEPPRLLVFCDGTWCGPETETRTNIQIIAEMVGISMSTSLRECDDPSRKLKAKYFNGIGLGSSFLSYLFNGATANDISTVCIEAYTWIAQNYKSADTEIWMFGLSRGAYTVRCVAGMINNCGIVKRPTQDLCNEVYRTYSSPYEIDIPDSAQSKEFRANASWDVRTPVAFMGLFDTVGSIGIPTIDAGNGPSYPTLWDQIVSSSVDKVYHACSLHDRLSLFQPCLTKEKSKPPIIHEEWFPGCHYDLGRQKFKFLRQHAKSYQERILSFLPNALSGTLEPNGVLSDLVLRWMLESVHREYPHQSAIRNIEARIQALDVSIRNVSNGVGSGDVYDPLQALVYAPFGLIFSVFSPPPWISDATRVLLALRDRRIPDEDAKVYAYKEPYAPGVPSIEELARITPRRYPSRTFQAWKDWSTYFSIAGTGNGKVEGDEYACRSGKGTDGESFMAENLVSSNGITNVKSSGQTRG